MGELSLALLAGAMLAGLLSSAHCAGMCGGIAAALQSRQPVVLHRSRAAFVWHTFLRSLPQNTGRITGYAGAGFLAGAVGSGWVEGIDLGWLRQSLFLLANLALVALGLSLMWGNRLASWAERSGGALWNRVKPLTLRLMQAPGHRQRFLLGLLWGAMPCALIYAMLLTALASGSALDGALLMFAFGLGTLPALTAVGVAWLLPANLRGAQFFAGTKALPLKALAGGVLFSFGVVGLLRLPAVIQLHGLTVLCHPALQ